jgi:hypothetical protein
VNESNIDRHWDKPKINRAMKTLSLSMGHASRWMDSTLSSGRTLGNCTHLLLGGALIRSFEIFWFEEAEMGVSVVLI